MPNLELTRPRPEIAVLTLNRPEKLNALSPQLVEDLHHALDAIGQDNDCRVVVLTGAGRGFCAGLDLTDTSTPAVSEGLDRPRAGMRWQERIAALTVKLHRLRQPVMRRSTGPPTAADSRWRWPPTSGSPRRAPASARNSSNSASADAISE